MSLIRDHTRQGSHDRGLADTGLATYQGDPTFALPRSLYELT
jgi:hypothetical protein